MKTKSKESLPRLEDILSQITPSEFKDNHLSAYKVRYLSGRLLTFNDNHLSRINFFYKSTIQVFRDNHLSLIRYELISMHLHINYNYVNHYIRVQRHPCITFPDINGFLQTIRL